MYIRSGCPNSAVFLLSGQIWSGRIHILRRIGYIRLPPCFSQIAGKNHGAMAPAPMIDSTAFEPVCTTEGRHSCVSILRQTPIINHTVDLRMSASVAPEPVGTRAHRTCPSTWEMARHGGAQKGHHLKQVMHQGNTSWSSVAFDKYVAASGVSYISHAERSSSALCWLKTYLRATMSQPRLNTLLILHCHQDRADKQNLKAIFHRICLCM